MTEAAAATPKAAPKKRASKGGKKAAAASHPPYKNMINAAIKALKDRNGSSRQAIVKYILSHYKVGDEKKAGNRVRLALRKGVDSGHYKNVKGSGASGSFRLAKDDKAPAKKAKKPKAKKAKKPKAKRPKKTTTKKPSTPKKPAAKKAKKPAAKKAAKPKKSSPKKRKGAKKAKK